MSLEQPLGTEDDHSFEGRVFAEPEFMRFRSLYIVTSTLLNAQDMIQSGLPVTLRRKILETGETLSIDVDNQVLNIWAGYADGAWRESKADGTQDVADAVVRRAVQAGRRGHI